MQDVSLVATVAAAFTCALLLGLLAQRLRLSPIVGYLAAGVLIGPHTPGFVGDLSMAQQLAEVGVILLMFGVGLHFHLKDLLEVKGTAIPGALAQALITTLVTMAIFSGFGFPLKTGATIGMAMAVSSTVVLMRVLMDAAVLESPRGHIAVGWTLVEDLITVLLLVLIPAIAAGGASEAAEQASGARLVQVLGLTFLKLAIFVGIVFLAGARLVPWVLVQVARLRSRELFTLTVLVCSMTVATSAYFFFGASMALGAFLAGLVVAQSPVSHQAAAEALPLRDAFAVLFFVSVGMLFDPGFILEQPLMIAAALGVILLGKPLLALLIVALLGHPLRTSLTVALAIGQIGEFSFILSDLARRHGLIPEAAHSVLVAAAIISIALNPIWFRSLETIESWIHARPVLRRLLNGRADRKSRLANQTAAHTLAHPEDPAKRLAIVVGYGPVGRSVLRLLREANLATVVIDLNMDTVSGLRNEGQAAIFGDASHQSILEQAGANRASHLVLTLSSSQVMAVVATARNLNPKIRILVRARYLREREDLEQAGANVAVFEEAEAAVALARVVLADTGLHRGIADQKIRDLRLQLITENIANIGSQRVRSVMVPWSRVHWLPASATREAVLSRVSRDRFSRWPVLETETGQITGYLHSKDLITGGEDANWHRLIRPLDSVSPEETIESILGSMQGESAPIYVVGDGTTPLGIITLGDILEQVVGQIEDEYPHEHHVSLPDALSCGNVVLDVAGNDLESVASQLVSWIPARSFPRNTSRADLAQLVLQREKQISTDLGIGVAVPHARVTGLAAPILVFGRSASGILFTPESSHPVRLLFLLITPEGQPDVQLSLLSQVARVCRIESVRDSLLRAESKGAVAAILAENLHLQERPPQSDRRKS